MQELNIMNLCKTLVGERVLMCFNSGLMSLSPSDASDHAENVLILG